MRSTLAVVVVMLAGALAGPARAGFVTGADLLLMCEDSDGGGFAEIYCLGYVTAVADVLEQNDVNGLRACVVEGVDGARLAEAVTTYLRRHPDRGGYGAAGLIADALGEAFPCG